MQRDEIKQKGLLRISELAKATGVSLPTIHFYVREGLIAPSKKTARNMAYYDPQCVEDIRLIKKLQAKRFLPLSAIKLVIQARQQGQNVDHVIEMGFLLDDIFQPVVKEIETKRLSFSELAAATGLSVPELENLDRLGLLMPTGTRQSKCYDDIDVRVGQIVKELAELGIETKELEIYSKYIEIIRDEATSVHDKIHDLHRIEGIPLKKLINALNSLKKCFVTKIYRQIILEYH